VAASFSRTTLLHGAKQFLDQLSCHQLS